MPSGFGAGAEFPDLQEHNLFLDALKRICFNLGYFMYAIVQKHRL